MAAAWDTSLPLRGVCETQSYWQTGALVFTGVAVACLGFVIFVTSKQARRCSLPRSPISV